MRRITDEFIQSLDPCEDGYKWWLERGCLFTSPYKMLAELHSFDAPWARWLITRLLSRKNYLRLNVYCARLVLDYYISNFKSLSFRDEYISIPRLAIEAAEKVISRDSKKNRIAAAAFVKYEIVYTEHLRETTWSSIESCVLLAAMAATATARAANCNNEFLRTHVSLTFAIDSLVGKHLMEGACPELRSEYKSLIEKKIFDYGIHLYRNQKLY